MKGKHREPNNSEMKLVSNSAQSERAITDDDTRADAMDINKYI